MVVTGLMNCERGRLVCVSVWVQCARELVCVKGSIVSIILLTPPLFAPLSAFVLSTFIGL